MATPLERQFGRIAGINQMTSTSQLGSTSIVLQFDLNRNIDAAARDVQAAINAARSQLAANLPGNPSYRKVNPADAPILILALTSDTMTLPHMYDAADSILSQKLAQVEGVGQVFVGGGAKSGGARRSESHAAEQAGGWAGHGAHRAGAANANRPKGRVCRSDQCLDRCTPTIRFSRADQYRRLIVSYNNGAPVRLGDVGDVQDSVEDIRNIGLSERQARGPDHCLPAAGREHHRDRGSRARRAAAAESLHFAGDRCERCAGPHHHGACFGRRTSKSR